MSGCRCKFLLLFCNLYHFGVYYSSTELLLRESEGHVSDKRIISGTFSDMSKRNSSRCLGRLWMFMWITRKPLVCDLSTLMMIERVELGISWHFVEASFSENAAGRQHYGAICSYSWLVWIVSHLHSYGWWKMTYVDEKSSSYPLENYPCQSRGAYSQDECE